MCQLAVGYADPRSASAAEAWPLRGAQHVAIHAERHNHAHRTVVYHKQNCDAPNFCRCASREFVGGPMRVQHLVSYQGTPACDEELASMPMMAASGALPVSLV